ncbi:MAG: triose-phosphate isomerase [Chloroflexi bacterium]|nr:triose-phosphate isomerase [Chloroflexota bacterium]MQC47760.1 triose-phosphate isomerase [Chloroflexota bacterium]
MTASPSPRRPIVGGNWKMNLGRAEARALILTLRQRLDGLDGVDVVVCPPAPWLTDAFDLLSGSSVHVGAQNTHWEPSGAFTGEVSAPMLSGVAEYVIVGHSERRWAGETGAETNRKLRTALAAGLKPILAVGERLQESRAGRTESVLHLQVNQALRGFTELPPSLVLAYEPVWAIGTGEAADPDVAQQRCAMVRGMLAERFGVPAAATVRIQYGGSVTPTNIAGYAAQPDIDGALVGGASLDPEAFTAICRAVAAEGSR